MTYYTKDQLVFLDETAKDDRTALRSFGYSLIGSRAESTCIYVRGKRYTIEAAINNNGIIASHIQEGPMSSDDFYEFIRNKLVSLMF